MRRDILFLIIFLLIFSLSVSSLTPGRVYRDDNQIIQIIGRGDTLFDISQKFNISINHIKELNPDVVSESLQLGEKIKVDIGGNRDYHIVEKGETLWEISNQYNYALNTIIKTNMLDNPSYLVPGEIIILPEERPVVESVLYFSKYTDREAFLVPEKREIPVKTNFYKSLLEELIKGPVNENIYMPVPRETEVYSLVVKNGVAYIDFSSDIQKANIGGKGEFLLIKAISNTLTEYREINGVKIYIEGRANDTIGGHIILDTIYQRDLEITRHL